MSAQCDHYTLWVMQRCCTICNPPMVPEAEFLSMKADRDRLDDLLGAVREALGVPEGEDIVKFAENLRRAATGVCTMCLGKQTAAGGCAWCAVKYSLNDLNAQVAHARSYAFDKETLEKRIKEVEVRLHGLEKRR